MPLSYDDIHKLAKEPSPEARGEVARKVAQSYNDDDLTMNGSKIAVDIFRLLLQDTEKHVRQILAGKLAHNPHAPHDIIVALAQDAHEVAEDILRHSEVLHDADLLDLITSDSSVQKLLTISQRRRISERVSNALIGTQHQQVIASLLGNKGADISSSAYAYLVEEYESQPSILELLVCRGDLSVTLAERLYSMVADKLKKTMTKRYYMPRTLADQVTSEVKENAIIKFLSPWMTDADVVQLIDQMHSRRRLTHSVILRALCMGEIAFFEAAVAKRANIPLSNARRLLQDPGESGFYALYRSSKLPEDFREAVRVMLKIVHEESQPGQQFDGGFEAHLLYIIREHRYDHSVVGMDKMVQLIDPTQARVA